MVSSDWFPYFVLFLLVSEHDCLSVVSVESQSCCTLSDGERNTDNNTNNNDNNNVISNNNNIRKNNIYHASPPPVSHKRRCRLCLCSMYTPRNIRLSPSTIASQVSPCQRQSPGAGLPRACEFDRARGAASGWKPAHLPPGCAAGPHQGGRNIYLPVK